MDYAHNMLADTLWIHSIWGLITMYIHMLCIVNTIDIQMMYLVGLEALVERLLSDCQVWKVRMDFVERLRDNSKHGG